MVGHHLGQHLLGAVGRRRDAVGGQHAQGGRAAQALGAELLGDQRRPEQLVLQPVAAPLGDAVGRDPRQRNRGPRTWAGRHGASVGANARPAPAAPLCTAARRVLCCGVHVIVVGCGRVGSGLAISLIAQGHSVAIMDKNARAFRRLKEWDGPAHRRLGLRPRRPREGRRRGRRRAGRGDQRRQHQHLDGAHRPRDLHDPQRGGPHLRPAPGRDLPAPGHPDRGHGHLDDRSGPPAPPARRGRGRLVRPLGAAHPARPLPARCRGPGGGCRSSRSPAG